MQRSLPETVTINAFTDIDVEVSSAIADRANRWGGKGDMLRQLAPMAPGAEAEATDWCHPDVGWGIVLPDRDDISAVDKASAKDAPAPIQRLLAERRSAPAFRYRADLGEKKLARYFPDGGRQDPEIGLTPYGTAKGRIPMYLLIVGSPTEIPWRLQYALNRRYRVGRLHLPEQALDRYVDALTSDWNGMDCEGDRAVVWSVNFDSITRKMEVTIADLIVKAMHTDTEVRTTRISGADATNEALIAALVAERPAVIVTSSHGKTGPLDNPELMRATLGLPVDQLRATLDIDKLAEWTPNGAIWYSHACCSAGSDEGTSYSGLLAEGSLAERVVSGVAQLGSTVAPLPTQLLSAARPVRAFVGHVEPTFDWTLIQTDTGQFLTDPLVKSIYPNLYRRKPLALSLEDHFRGVGELYAKLERAREGINTLVPGAHDDATYYKLTACDRQSLVLLGDPTVLIPPLPSQR